ncbi:MAG: hypothetical protein COA58_15005 [Bacteroidetes bacterium]|nr:MAG: hypothetical protein COA58_15005 [Bacteroidota bacterium]
MAVKVNYKMVQLAREARGFSQVELSEKAEIPQGNLSRMENGSVGITPQILRRIATELDYPKEFFYRNDTIYPSNTHYRKRVVLAQKILLRTEALMNIYRFNVQDMLQSLEISVNLPIIENEYGSPSRVANYLRSFWKVPSGPINNLSEIIESNGIIVIDFDFGTDKIEGRSIVTETGHPILFINKNSSGDRQRLTLAHELGHLIMHLKTLPTLRDEEQEAWDFAHEFLAPFEEVKRQLRGKVNLSVLADLKRVWKVSMAGFLKRLQDNGAVSYNAARYLWSQFSARGYRKGEPIFIEQERPTLLKRMINLFQTDLEYSKIELQNLFTINEKDLKGSYMSVGVSKLKVV